MANRAKIRTTDLLSYLAANIFYWALTTQHNAIVLMRNASVWSGLSVSIYWLLYSVDGEFVTVGNDSGMIATISLLWGEQTSKCSGVIETDHLGFDIVTGHIYDNLDVEVTEIENYADKRMENILNKESG